MVPNSSKYRKTRLKCKDGHIVDSISEKIIDEWLFENGLEHEKSKRYPDSNFTCDFYLKGKDVWVEYFGLHGGGIEEYEEGMKRKNEIVIKNGFKFISIVPKDLYPNPETKLKEIFKDIL